MNTRNYVHYAYENTYSTSPGDAAITGYFGHNVKFSASPKNNILRIPNLNSRNYTKYAARKFEGSFSADFDVSNWYFMKGAIGTPTTTGSGPYTHKYAEVNTPSGVTIQQSEDLDTDSERTLVGAVFDKTTVNFNVGEVITGKVDGFYASESKDSSLNTAGNAADSEEVFTFSHAYLQQPAGTTIGLIQSTDLTISNNVEMIWQLNSRLAQQRAYKQKVYEFKINKIREADVDILDKFYGGTTALTNPGTPASGASLTIAADNGLGGTSARSFVARFDNIMYDDYTAALEPGEVMKEGATIYALNLNSASGALYINNSASHL